jgi:hypothetical protein
MLTYSPSIVAASVRVLEESATPDVQCTFAPGSFKDGQIGELEETPGLSAGAWRMRPFSRGYVEGKRNRPGDAPAINPRLLPLDRPICRIGRYLAPNAAQVRTICQYDGDQRSVISSSHEITAEFGVIFKPKLCNQDYDRICVCNFKIVGKH